MDDIELELEKAVNTITLDQLFRDIYAQGQQADIREGFHISDCLKSLTSQCARKVVLSRFYAANRVYHSAQQAAIFEQGIAIHQRWQEAFIRSGKAFAIEQSYMEEYFGVICTPDIVADIDGLAIVELKGYNLDEYERLLNGKLPGEAIIQIQTYMWLTGIHKGFVLVENKNNQNFHVWPVQYDPQKVMPVEERLHFYKNLFDIHVADGRLPKRICTSSRDARAKGCRMCRACFSSPTERRTRDESIGHRSSDGQ